MFKMGCDNISKQRRLLFSLTKKDFKIDTFRAGGKGGQNQNSRDTGVRITHSESGAVGESREERSQLQNRKRAFERLAQTKEFKRWLKIKSAQIMGAIKTPEEIEKEVDEEMKEGNLRIEYYKPKRSQIRKDL